LPLLTGSGKVRRSSLTALGSAHRPLAVKQERVLSRPTAAEEDAPLVEKLDPAPYQQLVDLLQSHSAETFAAPTFSATVQAVKGALYERDYPKAFGSEEYLRAYVARWVPGRAMAYRDILGDYCEQLWQVKRGEEKVISVPAVVESEDSDEEGDSDEESSEEDEVAAPATSVDALAEQAGSLSLGSDAHVASRSINVLSLGAGPCSELFAVASLVLTSGTPAQVDLQCVDSAAFGPIVETAAASIRESWGVGENRLKVDYLQRDLLSDAGQEQMRVEQADLITLLYTTHELLVASRAATLKLLASLTQRAKPGTLLLMVESAGSFSAMPVGPSSSGGEAKQFPLEFLLDLVLAGGRGGKGDWEIVEKEESRWFRVPDGVGKGYPVRLENMRCVLCLCALAASPALTDPPSATCVAPGRCCGCTGGVALRPRKGSSRDQMRPPSLRPPYSPCAALHAR
jgi:25S rRNA (uracil2843-N3)-methyltransferase